MGRAEMKRDAVHGHGNVDLGLVAEIKVSICTCRAVQRFRGSVF
jgi:hypothetical protein